MKGVLNLLPDHYPFELIPLPYSYDALEPYIDTETVTIHHNKHLKTYVDNLNKTLSTCPKFQLWTLKKLITSIHLLPIEIQIPVKNNAGGVFNHNLYFSIMNKPRNAQPSDNLLIAIENTFDSIDSFKQKFKNAALNQFGSGYAWLIMDTYGQLCIVNTLNQDTPFTQNQNIQPLMLIDVWEHAYYLKYQNRRAEYIDNWWNVLDWDVVSRNYASFRQQIW